MDDCRLDRRRLLRAGLCVLGVSALNALALPAASQTPPVIDMVRNPTTGVWSAPSQIGGTALTRADRYVISQVGGRAASTGMSRTALSRVVGAVAKGVLGRALAVGGLVGVAINELHNLATGERLFSYDGMLGLGYESASDTITVVRPGYDAGQTCAGAPPLPSNWPQMTSGAYLDPTGANPCRLRHVSVVEIHATSPIALANYRPVGWQTGYSVAITPMPPATYAQRVWWYTYGTPSGTRIQLPGVPVSQLYETLTADELAKESSREVAVDVSNALQGMFAPSADIPTLPLSPWVPDVPVPYVHDWLTSRPAIIAPGVDPVVNWPGMPEEGEPAPGGEGDQSSLVRIDTSGEPDLSPDAPPDLPTVADWLNPLQTPLGGFLSPDATAVGASCQPLGTFDLAATFQIGSDPQVLDICPAFLNDRAVSFIDLISTYGPPAAAAGIVLKS